MAQTTQPSLVASLFRTKPAEQIVAEGGQGEGGGLRRSMTLFQLTLFSVGATLGTGIFIVLGQAVPMAGPAVVLSFVIAAVTAMFSALSYAELAGTIPVSGSSYSYAYATMGELVAWVCGWCLMLEYAVSVSAVAVGWGQYIDNFLQRVDRGEPAQLDHVAGRAWRCDQHPGRCRRPVRDVPAAARGLGERDRQRRHGLRQDRHLDLLLHRRLRRLPVRQPRPVLPAGHRRGDRAASKVFFSYIGFDAASTAGEEAKNPKRDLPLAIILSLVIVTILYVAVALAAVAAQPWQQFKGQEASLAQVLTNAIGANWPATLLDLGAIIAISSVVLTVMYGQTRILFAMARDGLIPKVFERVNPRTQTPVTNTLIVTGFIAVLAAVVPIDQLADATSIGTLFAFALVNVGVMVLRRTKPGLSRSFKTPLYPITPILGVTFCLYLMVRLAGVTWLVFLIWTVVGLIAYFSYGRRHSRLARGNGGLAVSPGVGDGSQPSGVGDGSQPPAGEPVAPPPHAEAGPGGISAPPPAAIPAPRSAPGTLPAPRVPDPARGETPRSDE